MPAHRPAPDLAELDPRLQLLDWRRRVAELYGEVRDRARTDPAAAHEHWALVREHLLRTHPQSPVPPEHRAAFRLGVVAYDPAFRFVAVVEPHPDDAAGPHVRDVATATDGVVRLERRGLVRLGELGTLDVWWVTGYGGGIFVPLRDATSGVTTYGGGRYVLDTVKGADLGGEGGTLVVDLNLAYPPSCAYDPAWVCPLPGPGNRLDAAVPVGEHGPVGEQGPVAESGPERPSDHPQAGPTG